MQGGPERSRIKGRVAQHLPKRTLHLRSIYSNSDLPNTVLHRVEEDRPVEI